MIKIFDESHMPGNLIFQDEVNNFLRRLKCDYKLHVACKDKYTVIVVEYDK